MKTMILHTHRVFSGRIQVMRVRISGIVAW